MAQQTRKDPRAKVLSMTVRYKSATLDEFIEHHSHDVSRGGMFIKTPQPFPPGTLLKFEVRIAEDRKVMQGVGRVVWKRDLAAADAERPAGMGVKFIKLDDDSRRLIDQLLSTRKDDSSAFDAEASQPGVDTEVPVGLGIDPLTIPASGSGAEAQQFFPKTEPAELPPPEDRTVMKQAAELLEEALREVGTDEPAAAKMPSLGPAVSDEKEDTKPGRSSKSADSVARLPAPKLPPSKGASAPGLTSEKPIPNKTPDKAKAAVASIKPAQAQPSGAPAKGTPADLVSAARGITDKAREISVSKAPSPTSVKPKSAGEAMGKGGVTPAKAAAAAGAKAAVAQPAASESARGSGRALFWFVAVAACAAGTWWLWRPRPIDQLPSAPAQLDQPTKPAEPVAATAAAPGTAAVVAEAASAVAPEASVPVAAAATASAVEPAASVAEPPAVAEPAPPPVAKAAVPRVGAKPRVASTATEEKPTPQAAPEPITEAPAQPAEAKAAAPAEPKPAAAPPPEPAAPAPPSEAAPAPKVAPKKKASAAESDNPY